MSQKPLNILLITSDQQHWNTLGIDNPEIKTPNLDRLARQGMLFERAYTVNPTCTPTRASIITGLYPSQHGAYSLGTKLDEKVHTVGEDFTDAGYATALVGKAHFQPLKTTDEYPSLEAYPVLQDLDFWREFTGPFYGFDHVELARNHTNESHVGQHYALWMEEKGLENWRDYYLEPTGNMKHSGERWDLADSMHWKIPEEYHYDAWISERSCALLEDYADQDKPFFLWSSFFDPHPAYMAPEPWNTMYDPDKITVPSKVEGEHDVNPPHFQMTQEENPDFSIYQEPDGNGCHGFGSHLHDREDLAKRIAVYYGMVSLMDKHIGIILDKLEDLGLADNTLVVFTTDHGHFYGHHGLTAKGAFHYEDMIKLPWIVRQPGKVPAGKRSEAFQSVVDLPVSFLSAAGLHVPRTMTGLDQTSVWYGEADSVRDHIICENRHQPTKMHCKTYVDKRYKITVYYDADYGELFDLEEDPGEVHNRWNDPDYAEVKSKMLLRFMQGELGKEPLPMPRIAGA
ncbi:MAG: sulfatase [Candidatus Sumerlaeota bacterium]